MGIERCRIYDHCIFITRDYVGSVVCAFQKTFRVHTSRFYGIRKLVLIRFCFREEELRLCGYKKGENEGENIVQLLINKSEVNVDYICQMINLQNSLLVEKIYFHKCSLRTKG